VIEESTKKGSQREWKIETEGRTTKRYCSKMPTLVTEMLNCVAKLEY
jgi:hypothetical protein